MEISIIRNCIVSQDFVGKHLASTDIDQMYKASLQEIIKTFNIFQFLLHRS